MRPSFSLGLFLSACTTAGPVSTDGGTYVVDWQTTPETIPLNETFSIDVSVTLSDGAVADDVNLEVNAVMPAHGHGMDVEPSVSGGEDGAFTVDGMLLHMSGEWLLTFTVEPEGAPAETASVELQCCDA